MVPEATNPADPQTRWSRHDRNVLQSSLNLARMWYEITTTPEAAEDLRHLEARERAEVRDAVKRHLSHQPMMLSKSRIKRLRDLASPQYRLRVGEIRVFYDVVADEVVLLGVVRKSDAARWLASFGEGS